MPWYIFALVAAGAIGVKTVLQKSELKKEHSLDYVVAMSLIAMIISMFLWPWVNWATVTWLLIGYIYLASVLGSVSIWLGAKALRHLDISLVAPQEVLATVFALGFAYLFLRDTLTGIQWLGVIVLLLGGFMLTRDSFVSTHSFGWLNFSAGDKTSQSKKWAFYEILLLGSMVALSLASIIDKVVLNSTDAITFIFLVSIFLFVNHFIIYTVVVGNVRQIPDRVENLGWLLVFIAILTTISRLAYAEALSLAELSLVIPLKKSSILIATIWGGKLFKEKHVWFRTVMAVLMLVGVWLVVR
ncbi:EamA family transporter [Patescibacteria group bacterium]|nr:EamA family transporter [Patescibacteria group bacterium]